MTVTWVTPADLGEVWSLTGTYATTLVATPSSGSVTYQILSGQPPGWSIGSSSGILTGTVPSVTTPTLYTIRVRANGVPGSVGTATRDFTLTVNPDLDPNTPSLTAISPAAPSTTYTTPLSLTGFTGPISITVAPLGTGLASCALSDDGGGSWTDTLGSVLPPPPGVTVRAITNSTAGALGIARVTLQGYDTGGSPVERVADWRLWIREAPPAVESGLLARYFGRAQVADLLGDLALTAAHPRLQLRSADIAGHTVRLPDARRIIDGERPWLMACPADADEGFAVADHAGGALGSVAPGEAIRCRPIIGGDGTGWVLTRWVLT